MEQRLIAWLSRYGLQAVFGLQMFGIVGLPVPDELMLTLAGTLARAGKLPLAGTLIAGIAGSITGITVSYAAGRWIGLAALRRWVHIPDELLARVQHWFCRAGRWVLTFGYFVPGVRHVTAIAAGSSGLGYRAFATYAYAGAVVWVTTFVTAGYVLGDRWRVVFRALRPHVLLILLIAVTGYVVYALWVRWRRQRDEG